MSYILFDIGGTKTRVALSRGLETFEEPIKYDTPQSFEKGMTAFQDAVSKLTGGEKVQGLAGGIRGVHDREKTMMIKDPGGKLPDWEGKPLTETFKDMFGAEAHLENDSAIVALGEAHFGAGKGYEIVAYHTVSTGVGGARVVNGDIDEASVGFEIGHQVLDLDRSILGEDIPHTLENLVSGAALQERRGVKPYEIPQDDPVWDELAGYLARGLKNTITYWSPDIIVLGGSMIIGDPRIFLEDIIRHTKELLADELPCPDIVDAILKDEGGLYGAIALLKQKQKNS